MVTVILKCKEYLNIHILRDISCSFPSSKILSWTTLFLLSHLITHIKLIGKKGICEEGAVMLVFHHSLQAWLRSAKLKPVFAQLDFFSVLQFELPRLLVIYMKFFLVMKIIWREAIRMFSKSPYLTMFLTLACSTSGSAVLQCFLVI